MPEKTLEEKVNEIYNTVMEIKTLLFGMSGNPNSGGLFREFYKHQENYRMFVADYESFKRRVVMVFAFAVGSGLLGGTIAGILRLMNE